jgi:hypothetical protein
MAAGTSRDTNRSVYRAARGIGVNNCAQRPFPCGRIRTSSLVVVPLEPLAVPDRQGFDGLGAIVLAENR